MCFSSLRFLGIGGAVLGLTGTALVATAPKAHAQSTQTFNLAPIVTNRLTDFSQVFTVNKFDTTLGTLTAIRFSLKNDITTTITVTNTGDSASEGEVFTRFQVRLENPSISLPTAFPGVTTNGTNGINVFATDTLVQTFSLAQGGSTTIGPITASATTNGEVNMGTNNFATVFSEFSGSSGSTVNVTGQTRTRSNISFSGGNTSASETTFASIQGSVTYVYTANTPEPGTFALLGSSLSASGLSVWNRRRVVKNGRKNSKTV